MIPLENTKVLVTGGAGFVGSNLVKRLMRDGAQVTVLDDLFTGRLENLPADGFRFVQGSVCDPVIVEKLVAEAQVVFDAAARNIETGRIRIFGLGRGTLSYPDFAVDALEKGSLDEIRVCKTLTYCTFLMRQKNHPLGQFPAGCPPFDKLVYGPIMKQAREAFRSQQK